MLKPLDHPHCLAQLGVGEHQQLPGLERYHTLGRGLDEAHESCGHSSQDLYGPVRQQQVSHGVTHTHTHSDRLIVAYCFLQVITQACLCTMKLPAKTLLVT